ncbi:hypothetical protein F5884DRAFT_813786 [Xylogone sp. PMI_703]|nr:hypothetical protein F5884DRAFT_815312 [Xylogone sp. PMI_703]KAH8798335.1 hypothetical protein F5884DRAFT_813786 [Xylogone sp. PMI_703]
MAEQATHNLDQTRSATTVSNSAKLTTGSRNLARSLSKRQKDGRRVTATKSCYSKAQPALLLDLFSYKAYRKQPHFKKMTRAGFSPTYRDNGTPNMTVNQILLREFMITANSSLKNRPAQMSRLSATKEHGSKSKLEVDADSGKSHRTAQRKCGRCGLQGHNSRTCRQIIPPT